MKYFKSQLLAFIILVITAATQSFTLSVQAQHHFDPNKFAGIVVPADSVVTHDPVMIKQDSVYYLFATGWGIDCWSSTDLKQWKREKVIFDKAPQWAVDAIPEFRGHIWAPDISYHNGQYYLFYSVSAFGKNTSCIGLAINKTLHPQSPDFKWVDLGKVIQSIPGKSNWNAIDPNIIVDKKQIPYMSFGSFWDGLKLVQLTPDFKQPAQDVMTIPTIATRKQDPYSPNPPSIDNNPVDAGGNAIEAPFIYKKGKYYYLFASIDYCCKGVNSNYKMIVGRAKQPQGPFLDMAGKSMASGGGTIVLQGNKKYAGIGHNAVVNINNADYIVCHAYDNTVDGRPLLKIIKIDWVKGWPTAKLDE
jgi:arabinan endo-1,5-alpha-L-arabinosidase